MSSETPKPPTTSDAPTASSDGDEPGTAPDLKQAIVAALKTVYDPEIPVDIYELGLIYEIDVADDAAVKIQMTLTSPACPVAGSLPGEVQAKVLAVPGVTTATIDLVWDPPWTMELMSEAAKLRLGFM